MYIELDAYEVEELLKAGSTNQKDFIKNFYTTNEVLNFLEFLEDNYKNGLNIDLRGDINGGILRSTRNPENLNEKSIIIFKDNDLIIYYLY